MQVDPDSALRGVRTRLVGAVIAASVTLVSFLYAMLSSLSTFGATFALAMGVCAFGAAVALLLSARHEEEVHALAARFDRDDAIDERVNLTLDDDQLRALPEPNPLEEFRFEDREAAEYTKVRSSKRDVYSKQTDGVL